MCVVKEGQVQISGLVGPGVRHVFSRIEPGEVFGEMAVLENKPRSASATAAGATTVYFVARNEMLKLVEGSPPLAIALLREISNRLREFNQQYIQEVLQTECLAVVGRFARSIVHDLKNPLNIISITAEMAGMEKSTAESRRLAKDRIGKQVDRISDLVNEIMEFTQGSHDAFVAAPTDYELFVQQLVDELRPEIELKSASIRLENPVPPVKLLLDPKRLRRVFYNLIHNATDAMPGGGKIVLRFSMTEREVTTEIEDSGPGIAPGRLRTSCSMRLRLLGKGARNGAGAFDLQKNCGGPSRKNFRAQRTRPRGGVQLCAAGDAGVMGEFNFGRPLDFRWCWHDFGHWARMI